MTIASEITRLQGAKSCIKASIEGKGVTVGSSLKLDSYYSCINAIPAAVYLTQAEYDDLPSSKLTDGIPYGIMSNGKVSKFIRNGTEFNPSSFLDYIIVGGGGAGGGAPRNAQTTNGGGGGGGGEVKVGTLKVGVGDSYNITIGSGGARGTNTPGCPGCATTFGNLVANGGCGGLSGTGSPAPNGGDSGSGCAGGVGGSSSPGGGAGAGGDGFAPTCAFWGGTGGPGICGYGGGGGGGKGDNGKGCDGGGDGAGRYTGQYPAYYAPAGDATNYGGGGGGGYNNSHSSLAYGGAGCQGVVIVCYKTDGSCGFSCATGGTKTTSGDYTVHTFTTDGTFTIVS